MNGHYLEYANKSDDLRFVIQLTNGTTLCRRIFLASDAKNGSTKMVLAFIRGKKAFVSAKYAIKLKICHQKAKANHFL